MHESPTALADALGMLGIGEHVAADGCALLEPLPGQPLQAPCATMAGELYSWRLRHSLHAAPLRRPALPFRFLLSTGETRPRALPPPAVCAYPACNVEEEMLGISRFGWEFVVAVMPAAASPMFRFDPYSAP